jgi:hypothetical protein
MPFPVPAASSTESADARRDERKRQASPPSYFYAQSQAIKTAVRYFEPLNSGYAGAAAKHKNRTRSALFVQLMAAFEFALKDFLAQTIDYTHIYDDEVKKWEWLDLDVATVLSTREGLGRLGAVLIHPLQGWQTPETVNRRYKDVFKREPIASDETSHLRDLWIVRHSVAHNGGIVTSPDARRLRDTSLSEKQVLIDEDYLSAAVDLLRAIVLRLETVIGPSLLKRWFAEAAAGSWAQDSAEYTQLKRLITCVQSRPTELAEVNEKAYEEDRKAAGA